MTVLAVRRPAPGLVAMAVAAAALVAVGPGVARACVCGVPLRTAPADGDTEVPTNARIVIRGGTIEDVTLTSGDQEIPVALEAAWSDAGPFARSTAVVAPEAELDPRTEHTLRVGAAEVTFTTGAGPRAEPPATPTAVLSIARAELASATSCGDHVVAVDFGIAEAGPEIAVYDLRLEGPRDRFTYLLLPEELTEFGGPSTATCEIPLHARAGETWCANLTGRDHAGNAADPVETCAVVTACAPVDCPSGCDLSECQLAGCGGCSAGDAAGGTAVVLVALVLLAWVRNRRATARGA